MKPLNLATYNLSSIKSDAEGVLFTLFDDPNSLEAGWAPALGPLDCICLQEFKGGPEVQQRFLRGMSTKKYEHVQVGRM